MFAAGDIPSEDRSARRRYRLAVVVAAATVVLGAIAALPVTDGGMRYLEGVALAGVFSVPGVLVLLSLRGRPVLLLSGAVLSGTLSLLLATAMPLLALPALVYGLAYAKHPTPRPVLPQALVVAAPTLLDLAGALAIFVSTETVCTTTGTLRTCREATTFAASVAALALAAVATIVGWFIATPSVNRSHGEGHRGEGVT